MYAQNLQFWRNHMQKQAILFVRTLPYALFRMLSGRKRIETNCGHRTHRSGDNRTTASDGVSHAMLVQKLGPHRSAVASRDFVAGILRR